MVTGVADTMVVVEVADVALVTISSVVVTELPVGSVSKVAFLIAEAVPVMAAPVVVGIPVVVVTVVAFADVVISLTAGVSPVTVGFAVVFSNITVCDSSDNADVGVFSELRTLVSAAINANDQHNVGFICIKTIFTQFCQHEQHTFLKIWHIGKIKNCILSLGCSISVLPKFDDSWRNLFILVANKTSHHVAAAWHTKFVCYWRQALNHFWDIAEKERKVGVLCCISWTVLYAIRFSVPSC